MKPPLVIIKQDRAIPKPQRVAAEPPAPKPLEFVSPLSTAQQCLGERLEDRGEMGYYLDGQPVKLDAVMRATNKVLKSFGIDQVRNSPGWLV